MSENQMPAADEKADSKVDAIAVLLVIAIVVCAAIFWVSGQ